MAITRRHLLQGGAVAAVAPALGSTFGLVPTITAAQAQAAPDGLKWRHAVSTFGDIKYPAGFKQFDYVNANAPKGGVARLFERLRHNQTDDLAIVQDPGVLERRLDLSAACSVRGIQTPIKL